MNDSFAGYMTALMTLFRLIEDTELDMNLIMAVTNEGQPNFDVES